MRLLSAILGLPQRLQNQFANGVGRKTRRNRINRRQDVSKRFLFTYNPAFGMYHFGTEKTPTRFTQDSYSRTDRIGSDLAAVKIQTHPRLSAPIPRRYGSAGETPYTFRARSASTPFRWRWSPESTNRFTVYF